MHGPARTAAAGLLGGHAARRRLTWLMTRKVVLFRLYAMIKTPSLLLIVSIYNQVTKHVVQS